MEMAPVGDAEPEEPAMGVDPPAFGPDEAMPVGADSVSVEVVVVNVGWGPSAGKPVDDGGVTELPELPPGGEDAE